MTEPESPPTPRRRPWPVALALVGFLALTTWDVLRNAKGNSPVALRRAAFDGDDATVRRLIAAHPEWVDSVGSTNRSTSVVGSLYEKAMQAIGKSPGTSPREDLESQFQEAEGLGATPLFLAIVQKHLGIAMILLDAGANPRVKLVPGQSMVPFAVYLADTNLVAALERRGANLKEVEPHSARSLLHLAVEGGEHGGEVEMIQFLLARGLPVNVMKHGGTTPLHIAASRSRLDLVQLLVANGADLTSVNARGETALDVARSSGLRKGKDPSRVNTHALAVVTWLEAFTATNQPPANPPP